MPKKLHYGSCTIRRTKKVTHSLLNMETGEDKHLKTEIVTEPCGIPLFGPPETNTGICRTCSEGWSVEGNRFATPQEKQRAIRARETKT